MFEGALVFGSSAMTALMCLQANEIGNFLGVIDRPDGGRKHHARPTPLMGGLAVLIPFLLLTMIYNNMLEGGSLALSAALVLTGGLTALGYLDDKFGLDAKLRLLAGIGLIGITILLDPSQQLQILDFGAVKVPFSAGMGLAFTILVVLGLINAVNMADGLNGIVPGAALIWAACLAVYSPHSLLPLTLALGALLAIVLAFNLRGKLFLGDAGAYGLAGLFSILTIHIYNRTDALTADIVVAWFLIPVLDCLRLMASRALRGRSPFQPDRNHLHHRLQSLVPSKYVFLVYCGMIGIPSAGAMAAPYWSAWFIGGVAAFYAGIIMLTSHRYLGLQRKWRKVMPRIAA